ncbi:zinc ribbon domain-containing protein [Actinomycetospora lemnae]|uniref:Zinc ribbon domain-containing protein n=1 Tax=Actinomycetospora lemnae TaxID=3019891 RepID=A0ABT5SYL2_9PSEU|nr:zinc ribbon domain-containing protein [Actinomycetospora sp. DW7H6]MDD7966798.1 zinc ribbon domain-containing protein [Actinomycetospora sp. DW7H6]
MPAPVPARSSSAPWIVAAAAVVVLAIVGAVAVVLLRPASTVAPIVTAAPAPAPVTVTVAPGTTTVTPSPASGSSSALQATADASSASVESLDGMWVPQLSSKRAGTVDNGTTYDSASIYAHYQALAASYPGALLLWSGDWSTYRESDYWVVISGQGFTTAAGANAWCDAQGFAADDCYAKRLSHTAGPSGASVPRS